MTVREHKKIQGHVTEFDRCQQFGIASPEFEGCGTVASRRKRPYCTIPTEGGAK